MKFTTVWFIKNEVATKSLFQLLAATVNKVDVLFSYIYENIPFNSKETCFLGDQCKTDGWKHNSNSKLNEIFLLIFQYKP